MTIAAKREVERLSAALARAGAKGVDLALVLGSGLGAFAQRLEKSRELPFKDAEGMPQSRVPGHAGRFVIGELGGVRLLVQEGRVHLYEGWSAATVTRSVRAFARLGCRALVLTNASGALVPDWRTPALMRIEDHINLQGESPLARAEARVGSPYDARLGRVIDAAAVATGVELQRGVYAGLLGPSYETPAEVRLLQAMGAHAVGMSTVAEASAGDAAGLAVAGISCLTNPGAGISGTPLNHAEVVAAGNAVADDFCRLLEASVPGLAAALD